MNNWLIMAIAFAATAGLLFATLATGAYGREPLFKPYWEDQAKRQEILGKAAQIGVLAQRGSQGVVVVGYRDQLNATNRQELLATLNELLKAADGYTVYLAPWATDNATKRYLSLLYSGKIALQDYLRGRVETSTLYDQRVDQALDLATLVANTYGQYRPLGGSPVSQTPPIYVAIFRNDTSYVVYEPFTVGRDRTYADWFKWVKTAIVNLGQEQGKVTP
ncbi:hypothetical protein [Pyrobaculum neutrophilum]|uniref:Uncharacterized protein n=1 Tax=Pyrobaculum neutrophilum (strain DSM 2338 / JCM 9278 / NBRC 100436 / V24Sta) TaxID=444157 RepID=B1Y8T0_PYRNV|nr:hypothetical protein [Pyrobaculum neutrophilum]ACB40159.1 conserved hypothetical protein [Pyrobaculum neutrophilum V24Sta]